MSWVQTAAQNALRWRDCEDAATFAGDYFDTHPVLQALSDWGDVREKAGMPVDFENLSHDQLYELVEQDAGRPPAKFAVGAWAAIRRRSSGLEGVIVERRYFPPSQANPLGGWGYRGDWGPSFYAEHELGEKDAGE